MTIFFEICTVIFLIFMRLQKTKAKTLVLMLITNFFNILVYYLLGEVAGFFLTILIMIRNFVFYCYDFFKIKPSFVNFLVFEVGFIIIGGVCWKSGIDLIILVNILMFTYVIWQNNMYILRIGLLLDPIMLIFYNLFIGSYVLIIGQAISLIVTIIAIIYYDVMKRTTSIIKRLLFYVRPKLKRKRIMARLKNRNYK